MKGQTIELRWQHKGTSKQKPCLFFFFTINKLSLYPLQSTLYPYARCVKNQDSTVCQRQLLTENISSVKYEKPEN